MSAGLLDYGSGRYKLIGRSGQDDYSFHAGDQLEVWTGTRWVSLRMEADLEGRWYCVDAQGTIVSVQLGMTARQRPSSP
jgi:Domain of unknown function (DUF5348)